jgi:sigma-B regulation protein RsbU (phosphoserine phosphatase)
VAESLLARALRDCPVVEVPAGAILLRPGQRNTDIYILLEGRMVVELRDYGVVTRAIEIPVGECIGEFSAIDRQPVSGLVRCDTDVRLLVVGEAIFWSRLVVLPQVARNMMTSLTERTRLSNQVALEAQRQALELERIQKELELARQLQASMVPVHRPLFPDRIDLEICGSMEPAAKVGGDFFDVFFVDDRRLFFCIGDGSGHGIGAALLMARTMGLLRAMAISHDRPERVLEHLNDHLAERNESAAFVTLFCGFYDPSSGLLSYANGGHCPPLICRDNGISLLPLPRGILVGAFSARRFGGMRIVLQPGELLFLFSDGITEAENPLGEPFGVEGCRQVIARHRQAPLPSLLAALGAELHRFTAADTLEDDGTMLAIRRPPSG